MYGGREVGKYGGRRVGGREVGFELGVLGLGGRFRVRVRFVVVRVRVALWPGLESKVGLGLG